jgi:uncharacterized protein YbjT (DUF2867 family)
MKALNIAIAGAHGYVGRHLIPELLKSKQKISALVRKKDIHIEFSKVKYIVGNCETAEGLDELLKGAAIAYYLVHSLEKSKNIIEIERRCAENFSQAAYNAGVRRIIYLSGLGQSTEQLSVHLSSRQAVGEIFRKRIEDTIEFRASAIFGAGSASYEIISFLVERLPILILPTWVFNKTQPVSINDAVYYLTTAADLDRKLPAIIEIGGSDIVSYKQMMQAYAKKRNLKRLMIPVPFLSLTLSSLWLHLITPLQARVGRHIIESLKNNTVVKNQAYRKLFPHHPLALDPMVDQALTDETQEILSPQKEHLWRFDKAKRMFGCRFGRYIIKRDDIFINAHPERVFSVIGAIGGKNGWYYLDFLWRLRAFLDLLVGGPGFSKGKSALPLSKGDYIDCWKVEEAQYPQRLLLHALMKMPGDAYLEFELIRQNNKTLLYQTALFRPQGLLGSCYWYLLYPIHNLLFEGLLQAIKDKAEAHQPSVF